MGEDAVRFRQRARDCRDRAGDEVDPWMRRELDDMAKALDDEADKIDAEEEARRSQ